MIDRSLPFIDLHRHLEGCVRLETMLDLASQHGLELPGTSVETLRPHVIIPGPQAGLIEFLNRLQWMIHVLADVDACRRIAYESIQDAATEGLDYLELRFSPGFMARPHGLNARNESAIALTDCRRTGETSLAALHHPAPCKRSRVLLSNMTRILLQESGIRGGRG